MKVLCIIQARMGSTRLPGKMLKHIAGKSLMWYVANRVKKSVEIDQVVLATGDGAENDILETEARKSGIEVFRGDEDDVLDRFYKCATKYEADVVVRVTGDCPFIDSTILDKVVRLYKEENVDYASNVHPPTFPDGFDCEVFSFVALKRAFDEAKLTSEREHVTPYIWKNEEMFKRVNLVNDEDLSQYRMTVDEEKDLVLLNRIIEFIDDENFGLGEVIEVIRARPELLDINDGIERNSGYKKSLKED